MKRNNRQTILVTTFFAALLPPASVRGQAVNTRVALGPGLANALAVNSVTNKVYVALRLALPHYG